jgi:hypothetical protein
MEELLSSPHADESSSWTLDLQRTLFEVSQLQQVEIPPAEIPTMLSELAVVQSALVATQSALIRRIAAVARDRDGSASRSDEDRWLTSDEAAALLRVDRKWLYRRARSLPFCRRLSRKKLLFSEAGLRRWIATRRFRGQGS